MISAVMKVSMKHGDDGSFEHEVHPVDDSMEKIIEGGHYINFNCCS